MRVNKIEKLFNKFLGKLYSYMEKNEKYSICISYYKKVKSRYMKKPQD